MKINSLSPLGVEVWLEESADVFSGLAAAMESEESLGVVVVRDLDLSGRELEIFLEKFGEKWDASLVNYERWPGQSPGIEGCPHLALLGNYKARKANDFGVACVEGDSIAEFKPATKETSEWHTDGSFLALPKKAIALYAPKKGALPSEGGETRFASCKRGFESLNEETKEKVRKMTSTHSWESFMRFLESRDASREKVTEAQCLAKPDQSWPVVRVVEGEESLYVNAKNTKEITDEKGEAVDLKFVEELAEAVVKTGVYAHMWRPGDLVIWDNRRLLHAASPFDHLKHERLLLRAEFKGEPVLSHTLKATVESVAWGYLDPFIKPKLTVYSGSVVKIDTVSGPKNLLPPNYDTKWHIPQELFEIHEKVTDRLGPHILTGPVAVRGAKAKTTILKIDVLEVDCRTDWAWTFTPERSGGAMGLLKPQVTASCSCVTFDPSQLDCDKARHTRLDYDAKTPGSGWALPPWGGKLDLKPFFGVMGIAPATGRVNSIPPSDIYGGNLDLKNLTKGSTLYLPVQTDDALFYVGDGHARQGDGEVCGTALETCLAGTFRFTVLPNTRNLDHVRVETPTELIALGVTSDDNATLDAAAALAIDRMLKWLSEIRPNLGLQDAYCLLSVAADLRVTQVVNGPAHHGAHIVLEKSLLPPLL